MEIILGKTAGFCYGVKEAVNGAIEQLDGCEKVFCLGEIVHNEQVLESLKSKGIEFVDDIDEVTDCSKVIIRAHGVPKEVYESAILKKVDVVDCTCPKVLNIHNLVEKYSKDGFFVVLCGDKKHPENLGTISYCNSDGYIIVEDLDEVKRNIDYIVARCNGKVLIAAQTTYNFDSFLEIEKWLECNLKLGVNLVVKNTICKATEMRQNETKEIAENVDCMVIVGGKNSSNTRKLYDIALEKCSNAMAVETASDLSEKSFLGVDRIGVMAGASTPRDSIDEVIERLKSF